MAASLLEAYKSFVRSHPTLLSNAEWLVHLLVWNPDRFSNSELAYEAFNSAVGLLAVYNDSILAEKDGVQLPGPQWRLWLAAMQQVQTLVELRAISLEERGKMSRYGPLIALEAVKALLRLRIWAASASTLSLPDLAPEEAQRQAAAQQLRDLMDALVRLRGRYAASAASPPPPGALHAGAQHGGRSRAVDCMEPVPAEDPVGSYNAAAARASAVHAAAIAPLRPPCACAEAGSAYVATAGVLGRASSSGSLAGGGSGSGSSGGGLAPLMRPSTSKGELPAALVRAGGSVAAEAAAAALGRGTDAAAGLASVASAGRDAGQRAAALAAPAAEEATPRGAPPGGGCGEEASAPAGCSAAWAAGGGGGRGARARAPAAASGAAARAGAGGERLATPTADASQPAAAPRGGGWLGRLRSSARADPAPAARTGDCARASAHAPAADGSRVAAARAPFDWDTDTHSFSQQLRRMSTAPDSGGGCGGGGGASAAGGTAPAARQSRARRPQQLPPGFRAPAQPDPMWWQRQVAVGSMQAGELLYILRPLVYVCLLKRYGVRSWRPWLASLALELLSSGALSRGQELLRATHGASWPPHSTLYSLALLRGMTQPGWGAAERGELLARRAALLRYLLRSPAYDVATRRLLLRVVAAARWVPGLRNLLDFGFHLVDGIQGYYTYVES